MTTHIDLPDGGWAEIKGAAELTNRDRKLLRRHALAAFSLREKLGAAGITVDTADLQAVGEVPDDVAERIGATFDADDLDMLDQVQAAFIVVYTVAWAPSGAAGTPLGHELTMDNVDDLPGPVSRRPRQSHRRPRRRHGRHLRGHGDGPGEPYRALSRLRRLLEGNDDEIDPALAELWREYQYRHVVFPGATEAEYDQATATRTDWMLAIARVEGEAQSAVMKRSQAS